MILAVIPSLKGTPQQLTTLVTQLSEAGVESLVVPTGATLERQLHDTDLHWLCIGENPGFARTINVAAAARRWDWLLISNDDVSVEPLQLRSTLMQLGEGRCDTRQVALLDDVVPKRIPTKLDAFLDVSLLGNLLGSTVGRWPKVDSYSGYRPFSFVIVGWDAWTELGGLNERFIYTGEDADFIRKARGAGVDVIMPPNTGIRHSSSGTSRSLIEFVLPPATWSKVVYLESLGVSRKKAKLICIVALLIRVLFIPVSSAPKISHLVGVTRSIFSIVCSREPTLPSYQSH